MVDGLNPDDPDTDGDGLSDGAEVGLGTNPGVSDNTADPALPRRSVLMVEPGITSTGLMVTADGQSVIFGSAVNQDCIANNPPFENTDYFTDLRCQKRAIRTNVGIKPGEFRYFETRRLDTTQLRNIGHGVITADGRIDPYCCFVSPTDAGYPYTGTPPSIAINSNGGPFLNLRNDGISFNFQPPMNVSTTVYYGFAVDYRDTDPVVYLVATASNGAMAVSNGMTLADFGGQQAMPMLYGDPQGAQPQASINLGLRKFHYNLADLNTALQNKGAVTTGFIPGVGAHRWALP